MLEELQSFSRNTRLFLLSNSIYSFSSGIFFLVFNIYIVEGLYYTEYFLGILLSASSFASALFSLPAGIIGDRIGRKPCLLGGTAATAVSMGLLTVTQSQTILFLANALLGFSLTLTYVSFAPFMMENTSPKERVHLFSVNGALSILGYTIGAFTGGRLPTFFVMTPPESLRATLFVSVILSCAAVIPLLFLTEKKKEVLFSRRILKSTSLIKRFLLIQIIAGFGAGLIIPFFNIFFRIRLEVSIAMIGNIFAVGNITTGIATFLAAPIAARLGKVRSIVITQLGSLPFLLMIAYAPFIYVAAIGYIVRGALMNMGTPIASAFMMEQVQEEERATVNGITTGGWNGSWAVSNIVAGALMSRGMYQIPFLITCVLYGISSFLYYRFFASLEPRAEHPG
jgi:MFS family permease